MILKRKFSVLICLLGLIACTSSKEDVAKKNFEISLSKQLNDPSSYEFVSIEMLKTTSKWDSIDGEVLKAESKILDEMAAQSADSISIAASMFAGYASDYQIKESRKYIEESKVNISKLNSKIKAFKDKLNDVSLKNEVVEYRTIIQFRSKNAFGALVLNTAYARFNKNLEVLDFTLNNEQNNK
jgi:hypothetical protein